MPSKKRPIREITGGSEGTSNKRFNFFGLLNIFKSNRGSENGKQYSEVDNNMNRLAEDNILEDKNRLDKLSDYKLKNKSNINNSITNNDNKNNNNNNKLLIPRSASLRNNSGIYQSYYESLKNENEDLDSRLERRLSTSVQNSIIKDISSVSYKMKDKDLADFNERYESPILDFPQEDESVIRHEINPDLDSNTPVSPKAEFDFDPALYTDALGEIARPPYINLDPKERYQLIQLKKSLESQKMIKGSLKYMIDPNETETVLVRKDKKVDTVTQTHDADYLRNSLKFAGIKRKLEQNKRDISKRQKNKEGFYSGTFFYEDENDDESGTNPGSSEPKHLTGYLGNVHKPAFKANDDLNKKILVNINEDGFPLFRRYGDKNQMNVPDRVELGSIEGEYLGAQKQKVDNSENEGSLSKLIRIKDDEIPKNKDKLEPASTFKISMDSRAFNSIIQKENEPPTQTKENSLNGTASSGNSQKIAPIESKMPISMNLNKSQNPNLFASSHTISENKELDGNVSASNTEDQSSVKKGQFSFGNSNSSSQHAPFSFGNSNLSSENKLEKGPSKTLVESSKSIEPTKSEFTFGKTISRNISTGGLPEQSVANNFSKTPGFGLGSNVKEGPKITGDSSLTRPFNFGASPSHRNDKIDQAKFEPASSDSLDANIKVSKPAIKFGSMETTAGEKPEDSTKSVFGQSLDTKESQPPLSGNVNVGENSKFKTAPFNIENKDTNHSKSFLKFGTGSNISTSSSSNDTKTPAFSFTPEANKQKHDTKAAAFNFGVNKSNTPSCLTETLTNSVSQDSSKTPYNMQPTSNPLPGFHSTTDNTATTSKPIFTFGGSNSSSKLAGSTSQFNNQSGNSLPVSSPFGTVPTQKEFKFTFNNGQLPRPVSFPGAKNTAQLNSGFNTSQNSSPAPTVNPSMNTQGFNFTGSSSREATPDPSKMFAPVLMQPQVKEPTPFSFNNMGQKSFQNIQPGGTPFGGTAQTFSPNVNFNSNSPQFPTGSPFLNQNSTSTPPLPKSNRKIAQMRQRRR